MACEELVNELWIRSGGRCECVGRCDHHAPGKCQLRLWPGFWEAHKIDVSLSGGKDTLGNCEALCIPCALWASGLLSQPSGHQEQTQ